MDLLNEAEDLIERGGRSGGTVVIVAIYDGLIITKSVCRDAEDFIVAAQSMLREATESDDPKRKSLSPTLREAATHALEIIIDAMPEDDDD